MAGEPPSSRVPPGTLVHKRMFLQGPPCLVSSIDLEPRCNSSPSGRAHLIVTNNPWCDGYASGKKRAALSHFGDEA